MSPPNRRLMPEELIERAESYVRHASERYSDMTEPEKWKATAAGLGLGGLNENERSVVTEYLKGLSSRNPRSKTHRDALKIYKSTGANSTLPQQTEDETEENYDSTVFAAELRRRFHSRNHR